MKWLRLRVRALAGLAKMKMKLAWIHNEKK